MEEEPRSHIAQLPTIHTEAHLSIRATCSYKSLCAYMWIYIYIYIYTPLKPIQETDLVQIF